ncbi:MAG TPA: phytanoyl-CoA dioxygenase family protein, partial [Pseudomonadales bacterium]|nr:phytanoyl-CoA dioxygenase family protein [Pseudomonadales bacterium]
MLSKSEIEAYHTRGFVVLPGFLDEVALQAAQRALQKHYPSPSAYFADPGHYQQYSESQFAGLVNFPFGSFDLNRVILAPGLVEIARQLLGTDDIRLCKGELWAKYQGAIDYDQHFHRDFGNHTLVVPRRDHRFKELTTFIYLSDVVRGSGATALIPREYTDEISLGRTHLPKDHPSVEYAEYAEGPAGTLVLYSYDVFHRGVQISMPQAARFMILADFARRDAPWID